MRNILSGVIVTIVTALLGIGAMVFGNSVAMEGLASLNRKYEGRCVTLADGRAARVQSISAESLTVVTAETNARSQKIKVKRLPDLERYLVPCE